MSKTISILGCGWLGFPLANYLIGKGWAVNGSTTSKTKLPELNNAGINACALDITQSKGFVGDFFKADYMLINVPPSKSLREVECYLPLIQFIEQNGPSKVIFISSTSVYQNVNSEVCESDTATIANGVNKLLDIERAFQKAEFETTIIRFGGLLGGSRYPGRFFSSDKVIAGAQQPVNLIHLDDCLQIIDKVLENNSFNEVFNGVVNSHPTRKEFYTLAAQLAGKPTPQFSDVEHPFKIVSSEKAQQLLGVAFKHPDLLQMLKNDSLWNRT